MTLRDRFPRAPFAPIACAAVAGILAAEAAPSISAGIALTLAAVGGLIFRRHSVAGYLLVACCFFLLHSWRETSSPGRQLERELGANRQAVTATGEVVSEPVASASGTMSFLLRLHSISRSGVAHATRAVVLARWRGDVQFGNTLQLFGVAEPVPGPRNPGEFDYRAYLRRRDVRHSLVVRYPENGRILARGGGNPILRAAHRSRHWMQEALSRGLSDSPEVCGVITGVILGVREETSPEIMEQFQQTGTLHLFAVAGLHVGMVAYLLWSIASVLRLPQRWAAALIIPALFFYAAVTGLNTSSLRAALMAAVVLGGIFAERRVQPINSLAVAAFIILCCDTNQLFMMGFQLSFVVVGAIVLSSKAISHTLVRWCEPDAFLPRSLFSRGQRLWLAIWRAIANGAAVSLAAWIGSLLLILRYFYLITPVSLLANLIVVPMAFGVLALGLISLLLSPLVSWLAVVFNNANWGLASLLLGTVQLMSQAPAGHYYLEPHWPSGARAEMTVLDLGAGGAVHLRARRADWLIDAGPQRDFDRIVCSYLRFRGLNRLDGLILTHGDSQHIGAAAAAQRVFRPRMICDSAAPDRSGVHKALISEFEAHDVRRQIASAGDEFALDRETTARVLFPPAGFSASNADDQALVVQLTVAGTRVLLVSDSGEATERFLVESGEDLQSEILIKGQHHSGESGGAEFLERVQPQLIIATAADMPEPERVREDWAAMVQAHNIQLFRQDETGAVNLRFFRGGRWEARAYLKSEIFRPPTR